MLHLLVMAHCPGTRGQEEKRFLVKNRELIIPS